MCYAREGSNPSGVVFLFFTRLGVIYTHVGNKKIVTRVHSSVAEHRIANPGVAGAIPAAPSFCTTSRAQTQQKNFMTDPRGNRTLNLRIWNPTRCQLRHGVPPARNTASPGTKHHRWQKEKVLSGLEPELEDSESSVIAITL